MKFCRLSVFCWRYFIEKILFAFSKEKESRDICWCLEAPDQTQTVEGKDGKDAARSGLWKEVSITIQRKKFLMTRTDPTVFL